MVATLPGAHSCTEHRKLWPPASHPFPLPKGTLISFGGSPLGYGLGGTRDPRTCPPTVDVGNLQRPLSCPVSPLPLLEAGLCLLVPGPLGGLKDTQPVWDTLVLVAAPQGTLCSPRFQQRPQGRPDLSEQPVPSWCSAFQEVSKPPCPSQKLPF